MLNYSVIDPSKKSQYLRPLKNGISHNFFYLKILHLIWYWCLKLCPKATLKLYNKPIFPPKNPALFLVITEFKEFI